MVDRVVDLVADQLDSTVGGEGVQQFHVAVADGGAGGIVRTVDQDEFGTRVGEMLDFVDIDLEAVLAAHAVVADFETERFGQRGERGESRLRENYIGARFGREPHQRDQGLRGSSNDLHGFDVDSLHLGDGFAQAVGTGGTAVNEIVVEKTVACLLVSQGKDVVDGPDRAGAGAEIEFDIVFVLVEPGVEQERLELHGQPRRIVCNIDSAIESGDEVFSNGLQYGTIAFEGEDAL